MNGIIFGAVVGLLSVLFLFYFRKAIRGQRELESLESEKEQLLAKVANLEVENHKKNTELQEIQLEKNTLTIKLEEREKNIEEYVKAFEDQKKSLEHSFQSLASKVLETNSQQFLQLAAERLDRKSVEHDHLMKEKSESFQKLVTPIQEVMKKLEGDIQKVEKERLEQFTKITEQLRSVSEASDSLRKETSSLSSALRRPDVRGSWGELQLKRVVELAGMSQYCDFEEQVGVRKEEKLQKPDMIVHLPNQRVIVIDSKVVLDAFLDAVEAKDTEGKKQALIRHAKNLRNRSKELARKSYWDQFENTPDFVVLFIPNEALLSAAVEEDRALIEDALADKIIIATPTTLVALLKAVAYGWQQEKVSANAMEVIQSAKELYERMMPWLRSLGEVGNRLQSAMKSYNESVGSLERRVLPSARRMRELGLREVNELPNLTELEVSLREIGSSE